MQLHTFENAKFNITPPRRNSSYFTRSTSLNLLVLALFILAYSACAPRPHSRNADIQPEQVNDSDFETLDTTISPQYLENLAPFEKQYTQNNQKFELGSLKIKNAKSYYSKEQKSVRFRGQIQPEGDAGETLDVDLLGAIDPEKGIANMVQVKGDQENSRYKVRTRAVCDKANLQFDQNEDCEVLYIDVLAQDQKTGIIHKSQFAPQADGSLQELQNKKDFTSNYNTNNYSSDLQNTHDKTNQDKSNSTTIATPSAPSTPTPAIVTPSPIQVNPLQVNPPESAPLPPTQLTPPSSADASIKGSDRPEDYVYEYEYEYTGDDDEDLSNGEPEPDPTGVAPFNSFTPQEDQNLFTEYNTPNQWLLHPVQQQEKANAELIKAIPQQRLKTGKTPADPKIKSADKAKGSGSAKDNEKNPPPPPTPPAPSSTSTTLNESQPSPPPDTASDDDGNDWSELPSAPNFSLENVCIPPRRRGASSKRPKNAVLTGQQTAPNASNNDRDKNEDKNDDIASIPKRTNQAVGCYFQGYLENPNQLFPLQDRDYFLIDPNSRNSYGTRNMIAFIIKSAEYSRRLLPDFKLGVKDISAARGGRLGDHKSHQNGNDADLQYLHYHKIPHFENVIDRSGRLISNFALKENLQLMMRQVQTGRVSTFFVDPRLKPLFCKKAQEIGVIDTPLARETLRRVVGERGHTNHVHLRLKCTFDDPRCRNEMPQPATSTPSCHAKVKVTCKASDSACIARVKAKKAEQISTRRR